MGVVVVVGGGEWKEEREREIGEVVGTPLYGH